MTLRRPNVLDAQDETVAADDLDPATCGQRSIRTRQPDFALDPHPPLAARQDTVSPSAPISENRSVFLNKWGRSLVFVTIEVFSCAFFRSVLQRKNKDVARPQALLGAHSARSNETRPTSARWDF